MGHWANFGLQPGSALTTVALFSAEYTTMVMLAAVSENKTLKENIDIEKVIHGFASSGVQLFLQVLLTGTKERHLFTPILAAMY